MFNVKMIWGDGWRSYFIIDFLFYNLYFVLFWNFVINGINMIFFGWIER